MHRVTSASQQYRVDSSWSKYKKLAYEVVSRLNVTNDETDAYFQERITYPIVHDAPKDTQFEGTATIESSDGMNTGYLDSKNTTGYLELKMEYSAEEKPYLEGPANAWIELDLSSSTSFDPRVKTLEVDVSRLMAGTAVLLAQRWVTSQYGHKVTLMIGGLLITALSNQWVVHLKYGCRHSGKVTNAYDGFSAEASCVISAATGKFGYRKLDDNSEFQELCSCPVTLASEP